MTHILDDLNPPQKEAVQHGNGPLLIFAGAGTGKTRALTYRIAYLIHEHKVDPRNILAVTFTNKAAREMKERIEKLVGAYAFGQMWVGTFHATCARMLRERGDKIGLDRDFTIYDEDDQVKVIRECLEELSLDERETNARQILYKISHAKEQLVLPAEYAKVFSGDYDALVDQVYPMYHKKLQAYHALDFDDLILYAVRLLDERPEVLEHYQRKFDHVLVDEYQDINFSQFQLVKLIADKHRNICCVGDDDQCVVQGTPILTPQGPTPIEAMRSGMKVLAGCGWGKATAQVVENVSVSRYTGKVVRVRTESGRELVCTPNHITFARWDPCPDQHYVYLMWRKDKGYRIGVTRGVRSRTASADLVSGFRVRTNQEVADKLWILKATDSVAEASFHEQLFAFQYGIPTTVFHVRGRRMAITQDLIAEIYRQIDTDSRAARLLADLYMFEEYPHHIPEAVQRGDSDRKVVNVIAFGDNRSCLSHPGHAHRVQFVTSDQALRPRMQEIAHTRAGKAKTWRVETSRKDYDEAQQFAERLAAVDDLHVSRRARFTANKPFSYFPASHLHPGMVMPVVQDGSTVEEVISTVDFEDYDGSVYDLSVADYRNYCAGGILVHNSIYSWRGADVSIILSFQKRYPDAKVVTLEQNYRSTRNILDAAYYIISRNEHRAPKQLWSERPEGSLLHRIEAADEHDEATRVVSRMREKVIGGEREYSDFVILYRMNAQSRILEDALMNYRIPYRIIGGVRFYERKEIKDVMAYLRLALNPSDSVSLKRILNVPTRGIGPITLERIEQFAATEGISFLDALKRIEEIDANNKARRAIMALAKLLEFLHDKRDEFSVSKLLEEVIESTGYIADLKRQGTREADSRVENVLELASVVSEFERTSEDVSLRAFLEQVALVTDIDSYDQNEPAVTLMTLHSAKGLEFPVVFMVGMEEGIFPHSRCKNPDEIEEERRLCYVGMTRAKDELCLSYAYTRTLFGMRDRQQVSRFMREIPAEMFHAPKKVARSASLWETVQQPILAAPCAFQPGDHVKHNVFGLGIIEGIEPVNSDVRVIVAFEEVGRKKLMLSFAGLEKVEL